MCGPIVGAIFSAAGSIFSGIQQSNAAKAQARVYERQATLERQRADFEIKREQAKFGRFRGTALAKYAISGVDPLSGTPQELIEDSMAESLLDRAAIRFGAERNAFNYEARASIEKSNARSSLFGGFIGALTPLVQNSGTFIGPSYAVG